MFVQDKIADMLTRTRNANQMRYTEVEVEGTKMTKGIAEILKNEGYIADYKYTKNSNGDKMTLTLKYGNKKERVIKSTVSLLISLNNSSEIFESLDSV